MKHFLAIAAVAATVAAGTASAATYQFTGAGNNSPLHGTFLPDGKTTLKITDWMKTTLTANASGISTLSGQVRANDNNLYTIGVNLMNTYFVGATQYWETFSGSFVGNGLNLNLNDLGPQRDKDDACLGVNCTPYNGTAAVMEFGFWGDNSPLAGGTRNSDVNAYVRCTSSAANTNGTCGVGGPNPVPVPASVALLGLGLLALAARRRAV